MIKRKYGNEYGFQTRAVHTGNDVDGETAAIKRPITIMAISCRTHCICPPGTVRKRTQRQQVPGSNAFVPSVVGLIIADEVIKDLTAKTL